MSDMVQAIHTQEAYIVKREKLPELIEAPCLAACISLYDKNIRTVASNGNEQYALGVHSSRGLFIHIDYDSLDDNNRRIAYELQKKGLVEITNDECVDNYGGIKSKVIIKQMPTRAARGCIRPTFDIQAFTDKTIQVANIFEEQDVFYGRSTAKEVLQQILCAEKITEKAQSMEFSMQNGIVDEGLNINIQRLLDYIKTKASTIVVDDHDTSYRTINLGQIYDEETGEFWANDELLSKHREFALRGKTSTRR